MVDQVGFEGVVERAAVARHQSQRVLPGVELRRAAERLHGAQRDSRQADRAGDLQQVGPVSFRLCECDRSLRQRLQVRLHQPVVVVGEPGPAAVAHDVGQVRRRNDVERGGYGVDERRGAEHAPGVRIVGIGARDAAARRVRAAEVVPEFVRHRARPSRRRVPAESRAPGNVADARRAPARSPNESVVVAVGVAGVSLSRSCLSSDRALDTRSTCRGRR